MGASAGVTARGNHAGDRGDGQVPTMTASETAMGMCGIAGLTSCRKVRMSLTPMNARIADRPVDRYTSRSSSPRSRKYSARRPSRANALAVKTR
jgi:hypothetical protein